MVTGVIAAARTMRESASGCQLACWAGLRTRAPPGAGTPSWLRRRALGARKSWRSAFPPPCRPMSRIGWRMVVNEGHRREASGLSSKPMTVRSCGIAARADTPCDTRRPRFRRYRRRSRWAAACAIAAFRRRPRPIRRCTRLRRCSRARSVRPRSASALEKPSRRSCEERYVGGPMIIAMRVWPSFARCSATSAAD